MTQIPMATSFSLCKSAVPDVEASVVISDEEVAPPAVNDCEVEDVSDAPVEFASESSAKAGDAIRKTENNKTEQMVCINDVCFMIMLFICNHYNILGLFSEGFEFDMVKYG
ncbi:hypothetical protein AO073_01585 [Pseudomonas syringae ICMP 11293]|uniref:hypothetical protein n=1 Tax=Pseudomonas syringae TaxID=317 RepID=UPI00073102C6|nr:hypothetical protein [Pseudomonas syringae]KTB91592.1 hypothetical protein AO073_01585 [Pseudomonas syringae ICMP 11293]